MSKIAYVRKLGRDIVHVSVSSELFAGRVDIHEYTVCRQHIRFFDNWIEAPRPTGAGFESDLRRCKTCERKGAFDFELSLAEARDELGWSCTYGCDDGYHAAPKDDGTCLCCGQPTTTTTPEA